MKKAIILGVLGAFVYTSCKTVKTAESNPTSKEDMLAISYVGHVESIISNNCITCHSGEFPSSDMSLEGYDNVVKAVKNHGLLSRINDPNMPMPMGGLMPEKERELIKKWVENNFAMESNKTSASANNSNAYTFTPPEITAINIDEIETDFLEKIPGHWVGSMFLLGQDLPWFSFDFRPIDNAQVHGLFEGGSMGNLFNTFFVADYKGTKTLMLRNGGILSGIYRTSYFVLTEVNGNKYLFEDAYGGKQIMWMEVTVGDQDLNILTYTSRFGSKAPTKHMEFKGKKVNSTLAQTATDLFNYPTYESSASFPEGMPVPDWGPEYGVSTSASYMMSADKSMDYIALGKMAQDPLVITDFENLASLDLQFSRTDLSAGKKIHVYLSREPLTDSEGKLKTEYGYISEAAMNTVILFPEINAKDSAFKLYYLHPGKCYLTCFVDNDRDITPGKGDFYSESVEVDLSGAPQQITIQDIVHQVP